MDSVNLSSYIEVRGRKQSLTPSELANLDSDTDSVTTTEPVLNLTRISSGN